MIIITACKCEFCNKILETHSGMSKHEKKCFKNPATKSCIICKHLSVESFISGKKLTEREESILQCKVEGTYSLITGYEEANHYELNDEYKYLYNSEPENYCKTKRIALKKLRTNCVHWNNTLD